MPDLNVKLPQLHCHRCGHRWTPRKNEVRLCPKCNSPYWDRPRRSGDGQSGSRSQST